ncbi:MAG: N-acetylmuramoyl-L-alanine amidase [Acidimicrobiia bacterium]|nr:N-acetylmuramoyl-L-alanine amidase [Acidimicrobiia bacterium]MYC45234.1 N-acetylmuramoyl-L-alanine amidase [Acidimicrobiia bacterium]MYI19502.1 N-acetylmuramoyl-L-alanine amidase [Acidimicrobiia bacterium]
MWTVALITVAGVLSTSLVAAAQTEPQLRLQARILSSGRIEVALQQRLDGEQWSDRLLPAQRFVPPGPPTWHWLSSSPLEVHTAAGAQEMRIAARRPAGGRIEVGLQQRHPDGSWSEVILPSLRVAPAGAPVGRWLASSPLHEPAFREQAAPPDEAVAPGGGADLGDLPRALLTPAGVPVAVIGRAGAGYLVRTPCGNAAEVTGGDPIDGMRVVLDPGHGGPFETGAVGPNGLGEDELNLTLSRAVLAELARRGISAATTRTGDYGSLLSVRAALADAVGAAVLISLHHNGPTHRLGDSPGTEVYVQSDDDETPRSESARLGGLLYEEITTALGMFADVSWSRLPDAGVLRVLSPWGGDAYGMIRRPVIPAVLVEYGYLSNRSEAELFATDDYIGIAAVATANAIEDYLNTDRPGSGFVERPRRFDPLAAPSRCAEVLLE